MNMLRILKSVVVAGLVSVVVAPGAVASLKFEDVGVQLTDTPTRALDANGNPVTRDDPSRLDPATFSPVQVPVYNEFGRFTRQAGSHPDFTFTFSVPSDPNAIVDGQ